MNTHVDSQKIGLQELLFDVMQTWSPFYLKYFVLMVFNHMCVSIVSKLTYLTSMYTTRK